MAASAAVQTVAMYAVTDLSQSIVRVSLRRAGLTGEWVHGYTKSNGTYVHGYERSAPDSNPYNNFSFPGNTNPYAGKVAPDNPDTYLQNWIWQRRCQSMPMASKAKATDSAADNT